MNEFDKIPTAVKVGAAGVLAVGGIGAAAKVASGVLEQVVNPPKPLIEPGQMATLEPTVVQTPTGPAEIVFTPTPKPQVEATGEKGGSVLDAKGASLFMDKDGLPAYLIGSDGVRVNYDRQKMKNLQWQAKQNKDPMIIDRVGQTPKEFVPSTAQPRTETMPAVLTGEQLAARHISVIQGTRTQLFFRESMFKDGGLLVGYDGTQDRNLIVAIVDGPFVSSIYMQDPRYDAVRRFVPPPPTDKEVKAYRQGMDKLYKDSIAQTKKDLKTAQAKGQPVEVYEIGLINLKANYEDFKAKTKQELQADAVISQSLKTGKVEPGGLHIEPGNPNGTAVVLIATGDGSTPGPETMFYFDSRGKVQVYAPDLMVSSGGGANIDESQTYPDPGHYPRNPKASASDPGSYPIGAVSPGMAASHEFEHDVLEGWAILRGQRPNSREYDTDVAALGRLEQARQLWITKGDNTGYGMVFRYTDQAGKSHIVLTGEEKQPTVETQAA